MNSADWTPEQRSAVAAVIADRSITDEQAIAKARKILRDVAGEMAVNEYVVVMRNDGNYDLDDDLTMPA